MVLGSGMSTGMGAGMEAGMGAGMVSDMGAGMGSGMGSSMGSFTTFTPGTKTVIRKKLIQQPIVRQKLIQQPIVRRRVVRKKLFKSVKNMKPVVRNRVYNRKVNFNLPAKRITNNTVIQPTLLTKNTLVNLNRGGKRVVQRRDRVNAVKNSTVNRVRFVNAPDQDIILNTKIQPSLHTLRNRVNLVRAPRKELTFRPRVRPAINKSIVRTQNFDVLGNNIIDNTRIKPRLTNVRTNVELARRPNVVINRQDRVLPVRSRSNLRVQNAVIPGRKTFVQPVIQYVINENETHHVHKPVFKRVPFLKQITVPTTLLKTKSTVSTRVKQMRININPSRRASTGFVENKVFRTTSNNVPIEVRGGRATWNVTNTKDNIVNRFNKFDLNDIQNYALRSRGFLSGDNLRGNLDNNLGGNLDNNQEVFSGNLANNVDNLATRKSVLIGSG